MNKKYTAISLFAGVGGICQGGVDMLFKAEVTYIKDKNIIEETNISMYK